MVYKVGFSTGWWNVQRSPELVGLAAKIGYGATFGVDMLQIDLETIQEFLEPHMAYQVKRVQKEMGLEVGLHALIGEHDALERGDRKVWEISHRNACKTVQQAVELGFTYINFHLSLTPQLIMQETQLRPFGHQYQVVGPDGNPLHFLGDKHKETREEIIRRLPGHFYDEDVLEEEKEKRKKKAEESADKEIKKFVSDWKKSQDYVDLKEDLKQEGTKRGYQGKDLDEFIKYNLEQEELRRRTIKQKEVQEKIDNPLKDLTDDDKYEIWKRSTLAKYFIEWGEIGAYLIIGYHMWKTRDSLWTNIVEKANKGQSTGPKTAYELFHPEFNAAIAAYYLKWHLITKNDPYGYNDRYLGGMSMLDYATKHKLKLTFEIPHVGSPGAETEGKFRLFHPHHSQHFVRDIGRPNIVGLCIDIEHMLSQGLDPYKIFKLSNSDLAGDFGTMVHLIHLGKPIPYGGTAHIPIPLGSLAQEALYDWLYMLRLRGFKDGYIIYERGGGDTPSKVVEQSIQVIRLLKENLDKGIPPEELPESFYGISEMNEGKYKLQLTAIREHAWDPLKGLIVIPEEEHTFLSRAAVEKGKAEEWKKAKFR